ncbi:MAG: hypothetical protein ACYDAE_00885 [Steroidobacteraceae bacterium]
MLQLKKTWLYTLYLLTLIVTTTGCWGASPACESVAPPFAVGQEWSLKIAAGAPAKIVIGRIEQWKRQRIVHVSIVDIPAHRGKIQFSTIAHVPFTATALTASVDCLVGINVRVLDGFEVGYRDWKEHRGGVYTLTVDRVIRLAQSEF